MNPKQAAQHAIDLLEQATGYPVAVQDDSSIQVLATIHPAGAAVPGHVIRYQRRASQQTEYLVCYQCGFALRIANLPPEERWDVAASYRGRKQAETAIKEQFKKAGLGGVEPAKIVGPMLGGLIIQLRSIPIGLRVDNWIAQDYPILEEQQREITNIQLNDNLAVLRPEVRRTAPARIWNASTSMNSAFAEFWARKWSDASLTVPYKASGVEQNGRALLDAFDKIDAGPAGDRQLIDKWAAILEIDGWYEFVLRQAE